MKKKKKEREQERKNYILAQNERLNKKVLENDT